MPGRWHLHWGLQRLPAAARGSLSHWGGRGVWPGVGLPAQNVMGIQKLLAAAQYSLGHAGECRACLVRFCSCSCRPRSDLLMQLPNMLMGVQIQQPQHTAAREPAWSQARGCTACQRLTLSKLPQSGGPPAPDAFAASMNQWQWQPAAPPAHVLHVCLLPSELSTSMLGTGGE